MGRKTAAHRKAGVTAEPRAEITRAADLIADSIREEEAQDQMADLRGTDRTGFRETAGRVLRAVRVIAAVRALVQAAAAISMVVREITEETADREPVPEIQEAARALREKLRQRIWKRGARTTSAAQIIRTGISAPERTTSTRKMRR